MLSIEVRIGRTFFSPLVRCYERTRRSFRCNDTATRFPRWTRNRSSRVFHNLRVSVFAFDRGRTNKGAIISLPKRRSTARCIYARGRRIRNIPGDIYMSWRSKVYNEEKRSIRSKHPSTRLSYQSTM